MLTDDETELPEIIHPRLWAGVLGCIINCSIGLLLNIVLSNSPSKIRSMCCWISMHLSKEGDAYERLCTFGNLLASIGNLFAASPLVWIQIFAF
jgi:hypothetical protein